jgi:ubiquinone/menaquinone biosynthesis C-methylase UbiE
MNLDDLAPPEDLIYIGGGNFREIGDEFFRYLVDLADLQPHHRVLDVGCGIGRIAIPLTQYLDQRGSYEGFDIVPVGIDWCRDKITSRFPQFRFQLADLFNRSYNSAGHEEASSYTFPYPDESFDLVFLASVLTHLLPADLENYLYEISRVLKLGGRCLLTYFLLNPESARLLDKGQSLLDFKYDHGVCRSISRHRPENAVCYDETFVLRIQEKYGLEIRQPIHYGSWCSRSKALSHQDLIVAVKARALAVPKPRVSSLSRLQLALRRCFHGKVLVALRRLGRRSAATEVQRHVKARRYA